MFGNATLEIPSSGVIGPSWYPGLSDKLALVLGRFAARTLSEEDGCVKITYSDGSMKLIGPDTANDTLVMGRQPLTKGRVIGPSCLPAQQGYRTIAKGLLSDRREGIIGRTT